MNKKGFTLIELLATLVVLSVVLGVTLVSVNAMYKNAKKKAEEAFVSTIKDAMEIYLSSDARKLNGFELVKKNSGENCLIVKSYGSRKVYSTKTNLGEVIKKGTLVQSEIVNPANEEVACANASDIEVTIYKDEDFVYYYSIDKEKFKCLLNIDEEYGTIITNLPEGFGCK